ncbi:hypothetical protein SAMN04488595_11819 [Ralstonia sp. 25mfcol4.1]|uniref:hypothetical protein n=1 Tax=Ralstonia sp. 25mfcol4.1 TaxID=1761899 RepID=UPI00088F6124|nr:hypothetical protein [Ralstonia sp. 25mfcol4.1]SDP72092.1 hypothetical protein SAMN04488595_11819 [Ralstonia sp. 25mfcol4.1]
MRFLGNPRYWVNVMILAAFTSSAGTAGAQADASTPKATLQQGATSIPYLSGGIGADDVARMRSLAPQFNVHLRFQDQSDGASLADVKVLLLNARHERVLRVVSEGPLLYMRVPPGQYYLAAVYQGIIQEHALIVGRKPIDLTISFTMNSEEGTWQYCKRQANLCEGIAP